MTTSLNTKSDVIKSKRLEFFRNNCKIVGYYDYIVGSEFKKKDFIIIPPAYGETKKDYISLSYYLVINGFHVIRYDATNHAGESDGETVDFI